MLLFLLLLLLLLLLPLLLLLLYSSPQCSTELHVYTLPCRVCTAVGAFRCAFYRTGFRVPYYLGINWIAAVLFGLQKTENRFDKFFIFDLFSNAAIKLPVIFVTVHDSRLFLYTSL